ncbi:MAG: ATP synthase F0 subunit B [Desulfobulbaceae bacterium]|nr:ATP synthase F0 subunit B [Desulfobulbaceae bacterium]
MLNIDGSLFIQIVNFLVLLFIMNIILYKPIRGIIAKRDEEMNSRRNSIEEYRNKAEKDQKGIEEGLIAARKEGFLAKESFKSQGLEEEKGILREAGGSVEQKLDAAKKELESKIVDVRKSLEGVIRMFSSELAEKILGRSVQ